MKKARRQRATSRISLRGKKGEEKFAQVGERWLARSATSQIGFRVEKVGEKSSGWGRDSVQVCDQPNWFQRKIIEKKLRRLGQRFHTGGLHPATLVSVKKAEEDFVQSNELRGPSEYMHPATLVSVKKVCGKQLPSCRNVMCTVNLASYS